MMALGRRRNQISEELFARSINATVVEAVQGYEWHGPVFTSYDAAVRGSLRELAAFRD